jgi:hypothetical protein
MKTAFDAWGARHNRVYTPEEYNLRLEIFAQNVERINDQNAKHILIGGEAVFGLNKFSDMSLAEFKATYLNAKPQPAVDTVNVEFTPRFFESMPNDVDWRNNGAITNTKDQGNCGSCWAFSATEAVESFYKISGKSLPTLSPQQITSCDPNDYGCNGGWPYQAFTYLKSVGGQESEAAYPYTSGTTGQTGSCKFSAGSIVAPVRSYVQVSQGETNLANTLSSVGPPSVCVAAEDWFSYTGGVLRQCTGQVDHCVQAVGFTSDYWIVRNSWGTGWGVSGYIFIARGGDLCLISDYITYPTF